MMLPLHQNTENTVAFFAALRYNIFTKSYLYEILFSRRLGPMVSLKDIAARCGVSIATVSKALNGQPDIGEETRIRITRIAEEMGYLSTSAARAMKTSRTYNLGVLFADPNKDGLSHEFFAAIIESFRSVAEEHGYDLTFINHNVGPKKASYLQHCLYRGVDGVLIVCADFDSPQVLELVNSSLPVVAIDHVYDGHLSVISDNITGTYQLVQHVYALGHREIAFIHGEQCTVTRNRLIGFHRACEALGIQVPDDWVIECKYRDIRRCEAVTRDLLRQPHRPTCIFFPDDYAYIGGMTAILDEGLRVPEDISAVGYDGIHIAEVMELTSLRQNTAAMGAEAAKGLINLIEHPKTTSVDRILVPGDLLDGFSVKDLNA